MLGKKNSPKGETTRFFDLIRVVLGNTINSSLCSLEMCLCKAIDSEGDGLGKKIGKSPGCS